MEVVRAKDRPEVSKRPMEVFCRVRGGLNELDEVGMKVSSETDLIVRKPESSMSVKYKFKKIFDSDSSQKFVFDSVAFQLVQELLTGKNGLLFAYGVTGSGKTYTMNGTKDEPGIMPRSVDVLFNTISPYLAEKYVFKPDKMNRFEIQSESDAKFERERDELKLKAHKEESTEKMQKCSSEEDLLGRSKDSSRAPYVDEDNLYSVFVTYVEVYNNNVYDLLEDLYSDLNKPKPLQSKLVREDSTHCMYAHGVTEVEVRTPDEAFLIFHKGQKRKHVAHTVLNNESSRAHTVFTIRVVQAPLDEKGEKLVQDKNLVMVSQLSLVDLAGSERSLRTNNSGQRLREAGNINNSLMTLRTCLECLRDNQKGGNKLIPYRASRLTHLFKHFFEGDGQVSMIVCVNPGLKDLDETLHVLRFAEMSQEIHMTHSAQRPNTLHSVFTPGRRRANRIAKVIDYDAIEKDPLPEEKEVNEKGGGESTSTSDSGIRTPLDVFNRFPVVDYVECDDEITLKNSINYWTNSLPSWNNLTNILNKRAADGREKIVKNERDFFLVNQEVKNWKSMYESEKKKQQTGQSPATGKVTPAAAKAPPTPVHQQPQVPVAPQQAPPPPPVQQTPTPKETQPKQEENNDNSMDTTEDTPSTGGKTPKFRPWNKRGIPGKVSRKIRKQRQNARLRNLLAPKNAMMVLHELHPELKMVISEQINAANQTAYTVEIEIEKKVYRGHGMSKMAAKQSAAENALKAVVLEKAEKSKIKISPDSLLVSELPETQDVQMKEESAAVAGTGDAGDAEKKKIIGDDVPWGSLASFALFKLFSEWQQQGFQLPPSGLPPVFQKSVKKVPPEDANKKHPVQLLNQIRPGSQYSETREGQLPHLTFKFTVQIDGTTYEGQGTNKKDAKKECAKRALEALGVKYD